MDRGRQFIGPLQYHGGFTSEDEREFKDYVYKRLRSMLNSPTDEYALAHQGPMEHRVRTPQQVDALSRSRSSKEHAESLKYLQSRGVDIGASIPKEPEF